MACKIPASAKYLSLYLPSRAGPPSRGMNSIFVAKKVHFGSPLHTPSRANPLFRA